MRKVAAVPRLTETLLSLAVIVVSVVVMIEAGTIRTVDPPADRDASPRSSPIAKTGVRASSAGTSHPPIHADSGIRSSDSDDGPGRSLNELRFATPIDPHATVRLIGRFGDPRDGGERSHRGLDLAAAQGTEVRAGLDGTVRVATSPLGGNVVWVESELATLFYGHLQRHSVATGQRVDRGDPLGTVGATGNARTLHLHFEVHGTDGAPVDPLPLLDGALSTP